MDGARVSDEEGPILFLQDIQKVYVSDEVRFHALRGVSLAVPRGQFVAIMGPSGSGKSTLMNLIGCLDRPTEGTYLLAGQDVSDLDAEERASVRSELLGFVFQSFNLLSRTTALENVELSLVYRGVPGDERHERALHALRLVGLAGWSHHTPSQMSGGQQQRVAIARALANGPQVLLADEPTGNLDSATSEDVLALLQTLNRDHGLTVVMVTHDPDIAHCASRIVTMRDGRIQADERVARPRRATPEPRDDGRSDEDLVPLDPPAAPGEGPLVAAGSLRMAFRLALRSLARSRLRAALTALGIMIGIAAVVTTSALGVGATRRIASEMATLGVNLMVVMPGGMMSGGARGAQGSAARLTDEDAAAIAREVPTVGAVAPVLMANAQVVAGDRNASTRITGTTTDYFRIRSWNVALGSLWSDDDVRATVPVCVLGETVRHTLFGTEDPVGRDVRVGRMSCTVVAVMARKGQSGFGQDQDDAVLVPLRTFRWGIQRLPDGQVNTIMVTARATDLVHRTQLAVVSLLHQRHRIAPGAEDDFNVHNLSDLMNALNAQTSIIAQLLMVVASVSLLVGGIGVMNIMLVSVMERTREIGIRMAIGARAWDILSQFLVEAVVLASAGGLAGLLLGVLASLALGRITDFKVGFEPHITAVALLVSGGLGVVFGFFPARRAARLDPIVALRHE